MQENHSSAARSRFEQISTIFLLSLWVFGYRALIRTFVALQHMERAFAAKSGQGKGNS